MPDVIDTTQGVSSFADSRSRNGQVDAWHRLGQTIGREMTVDEALDLAHMRGWNVRKLPLTADTAEVDDEGQPVGPSKMVKVPGKFLSVRTNPISGDTEPLGVVGRAWAPFQNEETTQLLYDITDQSGAQIETIGALYGGRQTFVTMKLPNYMEFDSPVDGSKDITDLYLAILNAHDGTLSLRGIVSPVRIVCANTQQMAESAARSSYSLRHTGSAQGRIAEIRDMLGMTFQYRDEFEAGVQRMIDRETGNDDDAYVKSVLGEVFGVGDADTERQRNGRIEVVSKVTELYRTADTVAPFKGTRYGVYNAVTEYLDHYSNVRGNSDQSGRRALRAVQSGPIKDAKNKAFALLSGSTK